MRTCSAGVGQKELACCGERVTAHQVLGLKGCAPPVSFCSVRLPGRPTPPAWPLPAPCHLVCAQIHSLMIKKTSAVTTTVLGEVKIVGLLVLSAMLLGEGKEFTMKMTLGVVLAMTGFAMYSHTKIQNFRDSMQPRVISLTANGNNSTQELVPLKSSSDSGGAIHRVASSSGAGGKV